MPSTSRSERPCSLARWRSSDVETARSVDRSCTARKSRNAAVVKPIGNRRVSASKRRCGAGSLGDTLMEDKADLYGRRRGTRYPAWAGER